MAKGGRIILLLAVGLSLTLAGCMKHEPASTASALVLQGHTPTDGATGVSLTIALAATFDANLEPSSVHSESFKLLKGSEVVAASVSASLNTAYLTPAFSLEPNQSYRAILSRKITNRDGGSMAGEASWSFTTGKGTDSTKPSLTKIEPTSGSTEVKVHQLVTLTFSEEMDKNSLNSDSFSLVTGSTSVSGSLAYGSNKLIFTPSLPFLPSTTYTGSINGKATDLAGNALDAITSFSFTTKAVTPMSRLEVGTAHGCYIMDDQRVRCWGDNTYGQVGDASNTERWTPVYVSGLTKAIQLAAGAYHTCALISDGTVQCWGQGTDGQLGNGGLVASNSPVTVTGLSNVTAITAGDAFTCALDSSEKVHCWGDGLYGQLGNGANSDASTYQTISSLSGVDQIEAGDAFACARIDSTKAYCWGRGDGNRLGSAASSDSNSPVYFSGLGSVSNLSLGSGFGCALNSSGMQCWGTGTSYQLGDGLGTSSSNPVTVLGLSGVKAMATGGHSCALLSDWQIRCWGSNSSGQLGDGTTTSGISPGKTSGLTSAHAIKAGPDFTCAISEKGDPHCWGKGANGRLGRGSDSDVTKPAGVWINE